jgi:hypothetical protein
MGNFPINVEKLKILSLSKTKVGAWATSTKGTEWLIVLQLNSEHGCEQKKLPFHFLDLTVLNSCIILPSCRGKISHMKLHLALVQTLLEMSAREPHSQPIP